MAALTQDRNAFIEAVGRTRGYPAAAGARLFRHALACINAEGYAVPAADDAGLKSPALGVVEHKADNTAENARNGDVIARIRRGEIIEVFTVATADAITQANVGDLAYVVDDQTVARRTGVESDIVAGEVLGVTERGGKTIVTIQVGHGRF